MEGYLLEESLNLSFLACKAIPNVAVLYLDNDATPSRLVMMLY